MASSPFTPAVGAFFFVIGLDWQVGGATITETANTGLAMTTATTSGFPNFNDGQADTWQFAYQKTAVGVATLCTVASAADALFLMGLAYSGVGSVSNISITAGTATGTALSGASVVVPTGAVLVAYAVGLSSTSTILALDTSTLRASGSNVPAHWGIWEYAGGGTAVTPKFSVDTTAIGLVIQLVLNPYHPLMGMGMGA